MILTQIRQAGWALAGLLALALAAALPEAASSGPLDPPGPPASTRPLAEPRTPISSLPFTADAPGSYFLTGHLTMATPGDGITVTANDVTIDLNGFTLRGANKDAFATAGVVAPSDIRNLTVKNGVVENFYNGINGYSAYSSRIDHVTVRLYANIGIQISASSIVQDCIVDGGGTGGAGIFVNHRTVVRRCSVLANRYSGITALTYALIEDNQIVGNDISDSSAGIFAPGNDVTIRNNQLRNTAGRDIQVATNQRAVIIGNVLSTCASIDIGGGGAFIFAPLQGQQNSNITRSNGYCP